MYNLLSCNNEFDETDDDDDDGDGGRSECISGKFLGNYHLNMIVFKSNA